MSHSHSPYAVPGGQAPGGPSFGYPPGVSLVDIVPPHIKDLIHPHWSNFPPVNPMWHYLLGVIYIILGSLAIFGNGVVIYLFLKVKRLRMPSNLLVVNLAIMDMLMLLSQFPFFVWNCFNGGVWMFSPFMCELYACFGSVSGLGSLWTLVFISYDRYNVIVHGVGGKPLTFTKAALFLLFVWSYAIAISLPPFFGWGRYIPEGILDSCSFDYLSRPWSIRSHGVFLFVCCYCVPLCTILYSYIFIVKAIVSHEKAMRAQAKKMNVTNLRSGKDDGGQSAEMRVAKVACINVTLWLICWTPYAAIVLQGLFFDQSTITPLVSMLPALLAKSTACYNPMVYALSHPRFRQAMQTEVPCCCVQEPDDSTSDAKSTATEQQNESK
uniref:Opsin 2 n=1 Tax=Parhyale hawaiensis TaxID=317513 RepID=A0A4Y5USI4_9CRUS|nr:opsin 2 [Parhyale hawaiensis]